MPRFSWTLFFGLFVLGCSDDPVQPSPDLPAPILDPVLVAQGKEIFRFDTFGDEAFWTDTLRIHEVITAAVTPRLALSLGLQVDIDALPPDLRTGLAQGAVDLDDPATTVALLKLGAVLGVMGHVETINGRDTLTSVGITCALCHSVTDNSFAPGIGRRLDGYANTLLNPGAIIATSPALTEPHRTVYAGWGAGFYDPRFSIDGMNTPIVIPPAYGLARVSHETFTGDGPVSYWNAYVAVTQMHGRGNFNDPRLGIHRQASPDLVTSKLPALREYQLSLESPAPPAGSFDPASAARGRVLFDGKARCSSCHLGSIRSDINLGRRHLPSETGMDPAYAMRSAERLYRTTPLRALWQHGPYFHDGSAPTLEAVVEHYRQRFLLPLSDGEQSDLVQFLKSI